MRATTVHSKTHSQSRQQCNDGRTSALDDEAGRRCGVIAPAFDTDGADAVATEAEPVGVAAGSSALEEGAVKAATGAGVEVETEAVAATGVAAATTCSLGAVSAATDDTCVTRERRQYHNSNNARFSEMQMGTKYAHFPMSWG